MVNLQVVVVLFLYFLHGEGAAIIKTIRQGHYWSKFVGKIPENAVAGTILNNQQTYVGRALHQGYLIPGYIKQNDTKVFYEMGRVEYSTSDNVEILCCDQPERFAWQSVKAGESISSVGGRNVFYECNDNNGPLSIGKVAIAEGEIIGNVVLSKDKFDKLYYVKNGKAYIESQYEVLTYDPTRVPEEETKTCIQKIIYLNIY